MDQTNCAGTSAGGPLFISTAAAELGLLTLALEKGERYSSAEKTELDILTWRAFISVEMNIHQKP